MKKLRIFSVFCLMLVLSSCSSFRDTSTSDRIRIGSKNFTEELLVGEMYALILEDQEIPVERRLNLAGTEVAHNALLNNEIDLYPEYTGTAYIFIMGMTDNEKDPAAIYDKVQKYYQRRWNLVWLIPAPMNNTNAIAVTRAAAEKYHLRTLSDLATAAPEIRFAAVPDFEQRPDGLAGLREVYGGFQFKDLKVYDPGLKYKAILEGQADAVIAFSTDGQITGYDLVLLEDDRRLWPTYQITPVIRGEIMEKFPDAAEALDKLAPLLTTTVLTQLNWLVDGEKQDYSRVAAEFLRQNGLIQ